MKKSTLAALALVFFLCACSQQSGQVPPPAPQFYTHTISSQGETLANISKWYTGSTSNWQTILAHNPGLDVKRMRIGTEVQIPTNMMVKTTPMPKRSYQVATKPADETITDPNAAPPTDGTTPTSNEQIATAPTTEDTEPNEANVTEMSKEEVDQMMAETNSDTTQANTAPTYEDYGSANPEEKKSFLSKFQAAAMKAQENALKEGQPAANANTNTAAVAPATQPQIPANNEQYQKQVEAAQDSAKAQMDAANAQLKAAQEQAAQAIDQAQKQGAEPVEQGGTKTRDQLIKELTQDY